jgi:hypothetical protein
VRIATINGSQKAGISNSGIISDEINSILETDHEVHYYVLGTKQLSHEIYREITSSDVIIFLFPLYVDSVPSNMLRMLIDLELYIREESREDIAVYAIINNGFYEGRQTRIAFEIMQNWCTRAGAKFCGGIGQGAGEMLGATKNMPIYALLFRNLRRGIAELIEKIARKETVPITYLSPSCPRVFWRYMAVHTFWHPLARKNKINKKDLRGGEFSERTGKQGGAKKNEDR